MYCRHCGHEVDDNAKFCRNCGSNLQKDDGQPSAANEVTEATEITENRPPKVWRIFALVGKILGIVCLVTSVIPFLNYVSLEFAIAGIVLSCLGRKAKTEATDRNCLIGLILSIIAVVLSVIMIIVYIFVLI